MSLDPEPTYNNWSIITEITYLNGEVTNKRATGIIRFADEDFTLRISDAIETPDNGIARGVLSKADCEAAMQVDNPDVSAVLTHFGLEDGINA